MRPVVHFEIPADDIERAKKFYNELFGWEISAPPGFEDYWFVMTKEDDGGPGMNGGMMKRQNPEHRPMNYIDVEDVDEYAAKVVELGGQVVMPKTPVPKMGWFVVCVDTENNCFGIWQEDNTAQ